MPSIIGRPACRERPLRLEVLEERALLSVSAQEQYFVYLLNRARHDPVAYQQEMGLSVDLSYVPARPPLAVNESLFASAGFHAEEMAARNYFGHQSQVSGDWPNKMARDHGYPLPAAWPNNANYIESIAAGTYFGAAAEPLALLIEDAGVSPPGHRNHLLGIDDFNRDNREIGVGHGFNASAQYRNYWVVHATRSNPADMFLTGVVFRDDNGNLRYDPGEGLGGVAIVAGAFSTQTNAVGGWSLKVPAGTYTVTASGAGFVGTATAVVSVAENVAVDFISGIGRGMVNFAFPPQGNQPPVVAMPVAPLVFADTAANVSFELNDVFSDPDQAAGDRLSFALAGNDNPTILTAVVEGGRLVLDFTSGRSGVAQVSVRATDLAGAYVDHVVTVTVVQPGNSIPRAIRDTYLLASGSVQVPAGMGLLANDTDSDGEPLAVLRIEGAQHGTLLLATDGSFSYTPGVTFAGFDRFTYRADDGHGGSAATEVRLLDQRAAVVRKLYLQALGREPEEAGLLYWLQTLRQGATYGAVAAGIFESDERLDPIIRQMYRGYLLREAEADGLAWWKDVWRRTGGPEQVVSGIAASAEFFASAGGSHTGWVTELYRRLLTREPEPAGLAYWVDLLDRSAASRQQVVLGFVQSDENYGNLVAAWYRQYLQRDADPDGLAWWVAQLRAGATQRQVQMALIESAEYRSVPSLPPAQTAVRLL